MKEIKKNRKGFEKNTLEKDSDNTGPDTDADKTSPDDNADSTDNLAAKAEIGFPKPKKGVDTAKKQKQTKSDKTKKKESDKK